MRKPISLNRSLPVNCPDCGHKAHVSLFLEADEMPVDCEACGARICTMGDMMDWVTQQVFETISKGLSRRVGQ